AETTAYSVGRPFPNTHVYVLDKSNNPVPVGVVGEIYIGARHLARGYFNRPSLTEASFVSACLHGQTDERLYRTGDLARRLSNGDFEYLGRADEQVKIRGFRVQLGEIEAALLSSPDVDDVRVVAQEFGDSTGLAAYIVPALG